MAVVRRLGLVQVQQLGEKTDCAPPIFVWTIRRMSHCELILLHPPHPLPRTARSMVQRRAPTGSDSGPNAPCYQQSLTRAFPAVPSRTSPRQRVVSHLAQLSHHHAAQCEEGLPLYALALNNDATVFSMVNATMRVSVAPYGSPPVCSRESVYSPVQRAAILWMERVNVTQCMVEDTVRWTYRRFKASTGVMSTNFCPHDNSTVLLNCF